MRWGCCVAWEQAEAARDAGFEFLDIEAWSGLGGDVAQERWLEVAPEPEGLALPVEAAHGLWPRSVPLVGPDRDPRLLRSGVRRLSSRAERFGIAVLGLSLPMPMNAPPSFEDRTLRMQLRSFLRMAGDLCGERGIRLAIRPAAPAQTDEPEAWQPIGTLGVACDWADRADHPAVRVMLDAPLMIQQAEPDAALLGAGDRLVHVHAAEALERAEPGALGPVQEDERALDFVHLFHLMRKIDYDGRIAINARWRGPLDQAGPPALHWLKDAWALAGQVEL
jgi:sugar phosphate isomerase/epimerase